MRSTIRNFIANEAGATAVEYGLILALLTLVLLGAYAAIGNSLGDLFSGEASTVLAERADSLR